METEEKELYLKHLKSWENCQKELEKQQLLIGGIREIGRMEMKREIQKQIALQRSQVDRMNWGIVLKIAAVVFFLVIAPGMIYYYQNMAPSYESDGEKARDVMVETESSVLETAEPVTDRSKAAELDETGSIERGDTKPAEPASVDQEKKREKVDKSLKEVDMLVDNRVDARQRESEALRDKTALTAPDDADYAAEIEEEGREAPSVSMMSKVAVGSAGEGSVSGIYRYEADLTAAKMGRRSYFEEVQKNIGKDSETIQSQQLNFKSQEKIIMIDMQISDGLELEEDGQMPVQFPVEVTLKDSVNLNMLWQVNDQLFQVNPTEIIINMEEKQQLKVAVQKQFIYNIELNKQKTQAILQK
jgi:hypothetical protein